MGDVLENVVEGHHLHAVAGQRIYTLLYGDETDTERRIHHLCQPSHFHLFTPEAGEVFDDNRADFAVLRHLLHTLKGRPLEGRTRYAVIYEEHRVGIAFFFGEVREDLLLVSDGVGFLVLVVIVYG